MFRLNWTDEAEREFAAIQAKAKAALEKREGKGKSKPTKVEGLYKQITETLKLLRDNPRHPGLQTHEFHSLEHPFEASAKVFEAYVQHKTPNAYRLFWCYGPGKGEITVIAITSHP